MTYTESKNETLFDWNEFLNKKRLQKKSGALLRIFR